jgi:hypothetical protein
VDNFNDDGLECGAKLRWHTIYIHHNRIAAFGLGARALRNTERDVFNNLFFNPKVF